VVYKVQLRDPAEEPMAPAPGPKLAPPPGPGAGPRRAPAGDAKPGGKVGRNEPCPCGSGRKYKKCHGAAA
jgi:preprotein translocase subunit SecA